MRLVAIWTRCGCLMLCCVAFAFGTGCSSTNNTSNPSGVSQNKNGPFSPFAAQPKKVQTTSDWIGQPRPN